MKIIIAHYKYYIQGGPEKYLFKFKELAEQNGCEVIPFSINCSLNKQTQYSRYFVGKKNSGDNYDSTNHNIEYLFSRAWHEFHNRSAYKKLKQLIKDTKPDLLYVLIPGQLSTDIFKAAHEENIPIIMRISDFRLLCGNYMLLSKDTLCKKCTHGDYHFCVKHKCVKNSTALSFLRATALQYARRFNKYKWVDAVITPPSFTANLLVESGFFPKEKVYSIPTFVYPSYHEKNNSYSNYVLCLGRFSNEKGFLYALKAFAYLKDIPVRIVINETKNNCDKKIIDIIESLGIESKVVFTGFVSGDSLTKIIANCLCVLAPAIWYENMPNSVLEAFSFGKPVIASNIGSLAEMVDDGTNGFLIEPKNDLQIAEAIRRLYNDKDYCRVLGMNALDKAKRIYSPSVHWKKFIDVYQKISNK